MAISTAVDAGAVARVLGIKTAFKDLRTNSILNLPQRIAIVGQGSTTATYATTKVQFTDAVAVGNAVGFGSPLHLVSQQLFPVNGDGIGTLDATFYPLAASDGGSDAADGDITPSGTPTVAASFLVRINEIDSESFIIPVSATVAAIVTLITDAINAILPIPMIATDSTTVCDVTSKWEGESANDLFIEIIGPTDAGVSFAITQPVGGSGNPDVTTALDQVGNIWESMMINCLDTADSTALTAYSDFGEGRYGALVRKPLIVFSGQNVASVATATTVPDGRKTDRVNCQLVAPGSNNLPFVIAARQVARIAVLASNNPPHDYGSQDATGLVPGTDAEQWDYVERDDAVKKGSSTIEVKDGVINISDVVTFFHPDGDPIPAYRYVVDIVRIQNILFNLDLIFATKEWDGAPLIPDSQATNNPAAKKPKSAVSAISTVIDNLALAAIISDPEAVKASIQAQISSTNPKRLDIAFTAQLSGNTNIKSIDFNFGFFFGTTAVIV